MHVSTSPFLKQPPSCSTLMQHQPRRGCVFEHIHRRHRFACTAKGVGHMLDVKPAFPVGHLPQEPQPRARATALTWPLGGHSIQASSEVVPQVLGCVGKRHHPLKFRSVRCFRMNREGRDGPMPAQRASVGGHLASMVPTARRAPADQPEVCHADPHRVKSGRSPGRSALAAGAFVSTRRCEAWMAS